jgi:hypothetical protein
MAYGQDSEIITETVTVHATKTTNNFNVSILDCSTVYFHSNS